MITRIKATNYRCFQDLDFIPNQDLNIIVGDNEAGKSTLLEIISLLISGRVRGRWATEDLNPYWFNRDVVQDYFDAIEGGKSPDLPEIDIEIFFNQDTSGVERLRGINNSIKEDCPGLRMRVQPDPDHSDELKEYLDSKELPRLIPTDLFAVSWLDFSGEVVTRQPRGLGFALVNSDTSTTYSGIDYKLRELIREFVSPQEGAKIAIAHRSAKAEINNKILREVNQRIESQDESFGVSLQMDQGAGANWDTAVVPHIEDTPFSMLGQGRQVSTKIALAMSRAADHSQFALVEEPENHLSHTQMQIVIERIRSLAGGRQLFITTHSSFVLNRLGLGFLHLMHEARIVRLGIPEISEDTISYFQKQSGYDTLRLALASKVVVVEGPSDEMIFNLAYKKINGVEPRMKGIDVITLGTRGKRALELGKAMGRKMAVLRDNDNKDPEHWRKAAAKFLEDGKRELFIGKVDLGETLEPQVAKAGDNMTKLKNLLELKDGDDVVAAMSNDKTEWAWQVAQSELDLEWPQYFKDAIEFIDVD
ncbi:MAG: AAA family ATPase [Gordonia sp. (in: high G+C Gram-positive bacteria)]|uniref:ATP-dependent nuclease n=1 Tax=Gordonia sp. (in: high G+C Gram-positive bacteria) TaxID=84139 RepID=UPI0039E5EEF0